MEIRDFENLKEELCKDLEQIKRKGSRSMGDIDAIDKLTHSIKNIDKIIDHEEGGEYSQGYYSRRDYSRNDGDGMWEARGSYGDDYGRGNSYARRGMHYVRGHYSRAAEDVSEKIQEMMDESDLTIAEKGTLKKALEVLRK